MKRYLTMLLLFAAIQLGIGTAVWMNYPLKQDVYLSGGPIKEAWLRKAGSPRMIFVGGSNLAFGINTKRAAHTLGYHPVNMGLHGGLGVSFMLNQVRPHLREGDIVVCSLEYSLLSEEDTRGLIKFVLERKPSALRYFAWQEWRVLLDTALDYLGGILKTTWKARGQPIQTKPPPKPGELFTRWGDFVGHRNKPPRGVRPPGRSIRIDPIYQARVVKQVNRFQEECKQKGVGVYFTYAPFAPSHHAVSSNAVAQIHSYLQEHLRVPLLDEPEELVYEGRLFFDAKHHLTWEGITPRTDHVIERLGPALEKDGLRHDPL